MGCSASCTAATACGGQQPRHQPLPCKLERHSLETSSVASSTAFQLSAAGPSMRVVRGALPCVLQLSTLEQAAGSQDALQVGALVQRHREQAGTSMAQPMCMPAPGTSQWLVVCSEACTARALADCLLGHLAHRVPRAAAACAYSGASSGQSSSQPCTPQTACEGPEAVRAADASQRSESCRQAAGSDARQTVESDTRLPSQPLPPTLQAKDVQLILYTYNPATAAEHPTPNRITSTSTPATTSTAQPAHLAPSGVAGLQPSASPFARCSYQQAVQAGEPLDPESLSEAVDGSDSVLLCVDERGQCLASPEFSQVLLQAVSSHGPHNVHLLLTAPRVDGAGLTQHWQHLQQHQQHLQHLLDAEVQLSADKPESKPQGPSNARPTTSTSQLKKARSAAPTLALPSGRTLVLASAPSLPAPPRHSLSEPELRPGCERASSVLHAYALANASSTRPAVDLGPAWLSQQLLAGAKAATGDAPAIPDATLLIGDAASTAAVTAAAAAGAVTACHGGEGAARMVAAMAQPSGPLAPATSAAAGNGNGLPLQRPSMAIASRRLSLTNFPTPAPPGGVVPPALLPSRCLLEVAKRQVEEALMASHVEGVAGPCDALAGVAGPGDVTAAAAVAAIAPAAAAVVTAPGAADAAVAAAVGPGDVNATAAAVAAGPGDITAAAATAAAAGAAVATAAAPTTAVAAAAGPEVAAVVAVATAAATAAAAAVGPLESAGATASVMEARQRPDSPEGPQTPVVGSGQVLGVAPGLESGPVLGVERCMGKESCVTCIGDVTDQAVAAGPAVAKSTPTEAAAAAATAMPAAAATPAPEPAAAVVGTSGSVLTGAASAARPSPVGAVRLSPRLTTTLTTRASPSTQQAASLALTPSIRQRSLQAPCSPSQAASGTGGSGMPAGTSSTRLLLPPLSVACPASPAQPVRSPQSSSAARLHNPSAAHLPATRPGPTPSTPSTPSLPSLPASRPASGHLGKAPFSLPGSLAASSPSAAPNSSVTDGVQDAGTEDNTTSAPRTPRVADSRLRSGGGGGLAPISPLSLAPASTALVPHALVPLSPVPPLQPPPPGAPPSPRPSCRKPLPALPVMQEAAAAAAAAAPSCTAAAAPGCAAAAADDGAALPSAPCAATVDLLAAELCSPDEQGAPPAGPCVTDSGRLRAMEAQAAQLELLAQLLHMGGQLLVAERAYLRAVHLHVACLGEADPRSLRSLTAAAECCACLGRHEGASAFRRRIWQLHASQQGASHPSSLAAMVALAQALAVKGDHGGAADLLRRASRGLDSVLGQHHASSTSCLKQLAAELRHVQGSQQQRLSVLREVHSRCVEGPAGASSPEGLAALHALAACLQSLGLCEEAEGCWQREVQLLSEAGRPDTEPQAMAALTSFAACLYGKGCLEAALPLYERLAVAREAAYGAHHPDAKDAQQLVKGVRAQLARQK